MIATITFIKIHLESTEQGTKLLVFREHQGCLISGDDRVQGVKQW